MDGQQNQLQPDVKKQSTSPNKWHMWVPLLIVVGVLLYAVISYFAVSQFKSKPTSSITPAPSATVVMQSPAPANDAVQKDLKEAYARALENPEVELKDDAPGNEVLRHNTDYDLTYEANENKFTIIIFNPKLDETRKAVEEYLVKERLRTDDKNVLCAVNVFITAHHKADPSGKWGGYTKFSFCE